MTDKKKKWNLKKYNKPNANLKTFRLDINEWFKYEKGETLQLISPVNTDDVMFIWKSKPVLSFSEKLSRYQNSEILLSLNVIALSNSFMYIGLLQAWQGLGSFFLQNYFYIKLMIVIFIKICDVQYWKSNSICNKK